MMQAMNLTNRRIIQNSMLLGILFVNLYLSGSVNGETIRVNSVPALQTAISKASAGDILELENGTYLNNNLTINKSNITVKAASPGGVILNGTNDINITGNYIIFTGFQFISGDIGGAYLIEVSGSFNLLSELNFNGYSALN